MEKKLFHSAEAAARFASSIVSTWQTEGGEQWDAETLIDVAACADGESGMEDTYIVDENGAIGLIRDDGQNIFWWVTPADGAAPHPMQGTPAAAPQRYGVKAGNPGLVGFSERYRDPRILAYKEKEKKRSGGCLLTLAALVPVGTALLGLFGWMNGENDLEAVLLLTGLSLIPAAVLLLAALIKKAASRREKPMWEGTVIDKTKKQERDYHAEKHREQDTYYYTRYILHVRRDDGKKETFCAIDDPAFYGYYQIGDRIRYHPVLEYYEKYDKSHDNMIYCACCRQRNPIGNDTCENCGMPLFK